MGKMIESALETYLGVYRSLIAVEPIDANSITISFPFHLAGNHRIEITVTDLANERCIISDAGRTLGELQAAGHSLTSQMKEKLEDLANLSGLGVVNENLVVECSYAELGGTIQKFLEMSKMIGDVYLVHKQRTPSEDNLVAQVRTVLDSKRVLYREGEKIRGELELHPFHIVAPPNGHPGLAVSILGGQNTHQLAQVWGFKCDDIRREKRNERIKLALVYDVRFSAWSSASKAILEHRADLAIPGNSIRSLAERLEEKGIVDPKKNRR